MLIGEVLCCSGGPAFLRPCGRAAALHHTAFGSFAWPAAERRSSKAFVGNSAHIAKLPFKPKQDKSITYIEIQIAFYYIHFESVALLIY